MCRGILVWCLPPGEHSRNDNWSIRTHIFVIDLNVFVDSILWPPPFYLEMSTHRSRPPIFSAFFDGPADLLVIMAHFPCSELMLMKRETGTWISGPLLPSRQPPHPSPALLPSSPRLSLIFHLQVLKRLEEIDKSGWPPLMGEWSPDAGDLAGGARGVRPAWGHWMTRRARGLSWPCWGGHRNSFRPVTPRARASSPGQICR